MSMELSITLLRHSQIGDISCVFARVGITKRHFAICGGVHWQGLKEQRDKKPTDCTLCKEVVCDSVDDIRFVRIQGAD